MQASGGAGASVLRPPLRPLQIAGAGAGAGENSGSPGREIQQRDLRQGKVSLMIIKQFSA